MADGASALLWVFTGEGHDLTPLFGGNRGRTSPAGGICEPVSYLGFSEAGLGTFAPALFPVTDTVLAQMQVAGDVACGMALIGHENDASAGDHRVFFATSLDQGLQGVSLDLGDGNGNGFWAGHEVSPSETSGMPSF